MPTYKFKVNELNCQACVKLVTKQLNKIPGITNIKIDLETGWAEIDTDRDIASPEIEQALIINN